MPEFALLIAYANRMCSLLSEGVACPDVALFLNCEGEWSGAYQPTEEIAAALDYAGVDFDLISADHLSDSEACAEKLCINGMELDGLVIPWAEALPETLLSDVLRLADGGVPIWFVGALPSRCSQGGGENALKRLALSSTVHVVKAEELAGALDRQGIPQLCPTAAQPYLRRYRYRHPDGEVFFFVNEGPSARISCALEGHPEGPAYVYDPFENQLTAADDAWRLDLPPYGSKVIIVPREPLAMTEPVPAQPECWRAVELGPCTVALNPAAGSSVQPAELALDHPGYVSQLEGLECFSGRLSYRFEVDVEHVTLPARIVLEGVREGATVRVNGHACGTRICPDYPFAVEGLVEGPNVVEVELNTTLARQMHDFLSSFMPLEPVGLTGARLEMARLPE